MRILVRTAVAGAVLFALLPASPLRADTTPTAYTEYHERIKVAQTVQPLGETPFGESINQYKGGVSFNQLDINYTGQGPAIQFARGYDVGGGRNTVGNEESMGDWTLSVPRIQTIVTGDRLGQHGYWQVETGQPDARCSQFGRITPAPYPEPDFSWWSGYQLITGDGNSQPLLYRTSENTRVPSTGGPYNLVTAQNWVVSCLSTTANGEPGEGFLAIAPDGTKYWFDQLVYGPKVETLTWQIDIGSSMTSSSGTGGSEESDTGQEETSATEGQELDDGATTNVGGGGTTFYFPRKLAYLYVTKIEDRFGNTVTYHYTANKLTSISASDGRAVQVNWRSDAAVVDNIVLQPGDANAQTWRYEYNNPTTTIRTLSRVVLPDLSAWTFAMDDLAWLQPGSPYSAGQQTCGLRMMANAPLSGPSDWNAIITHPSGLTGRFDFSTQAFARSAVPVTCSLPPWVPFYQGYYTELSPPVYLSISLYEKTFSGPGMTMQKWNYRYSDASGSLASECPTTCYDTAWVEVTDPDGSITRFTHSTRWGSTEGKLLSVMQGIATGGQTSPTGLNLRTYSYASSSGGAYPSRVGDVLDSGFVVNNNDTIERISPQQQSILTQQGVTFTSTTNSFDVYANPLSVTRSSSGGAGVAGGPSSRMEAMTYAHDTAKWVIGLPATTTDVTDSLNPKVISETLYNSAMLPATTKRFGFVQNTLTYNANGTLAKVIDGRGKEIVLSDWYRGVPRRIDYPTSVYETATVNALGWITGTTDELGYATTYAYDTMGRLSGITYPTADSTTWNPLGRGFVAVAGTEYGLGAGHWKQTVNTGNGKATTYYDALWRPVLVLSEDTGNAASKSFVVTRYDADGRVAFQSYPVGSLTTVNDTLTGATTTYDALGRVYQVKQDSELGLLTSTNEYLTGFITRVTNPRGYVSETKYQLFDSPSTDAPVEIITAKDRPEQQKTVIERDIYGKPLSVTRSGAAP